MEISNTMISTSSSSSGSIIGEREQANLVVQLDNLCHRQSGVTHTVNVLCDSKFTHIMNPICHNATMNHVPSVQVLVVLSKDTI